jgi:hypothetical protein
MSRLADAAAERGDLARSYLAHTMLDSDANEKLVEELAAYSMDIDEALTSISFSQ